MRYTGVPRVGSLRGRRGVVEAGCTHAIGAWPKAVPACTWTVFGANAVIAVRLQQAQRPLQGVRDDKGRQRESSVEATTGAVAVGGDGGSCFRPLSPGAGASPPCRDSVSSRRSSNRMCGFPASGSRTRSCLRPRKARRALRKAREPVLLPESLVREAHILPGPRLVLTTEPLAQPSRIPAEDEATPVDVAEQRRNRRPLRGPLPLPPRPSSSSTAISSHALTQPNRGPSLTRRAMDRINSACGIWPK